MLRGDRPARQACSLQARAAAQRGMRGAGRWPPSGPWDLQPDPRVWAGEVGRASRKTAVGGRATGKMEQPWGRLEGPSGELWTERGTEAAQEEEEKGEVQAPAQDQCMGCKAVW